MSCFDREKAREVLREGGLWQQYEDPMLDALAGCVMDDSRIVRLEALVAPGSNDLGVDRLMRQVRSILRGEA